MCIVTCTPPQVQAMARIATSMQLFGGICTYDRVLKEMIGWSDHSLHTFAGQALINDRTRH